MYAAYRAAANARDGSVGYVCRGIYGTVGNAEEDGRLDFGGKFVIRI